MEGGVHAHRESKHNGRGGRTSSLMTGCRILSWLNTPRGEKVNPFRSVCAEDKTGPKKSNRIRNWCRKLKKRKEGTIALGAIQIFHHKKNLFTKTKPVASRSQILNLGFIKFILAAH